MRVKAPRGWGWLANPRKAAYNRVYNQTTVGLGKGCALVIVVGLAASVAIATAALAP